MLLPTIEGFYQKLDVFPGQSVTFDISSKVLILPTGNITILPNFNEYSIGRTLASGTYTFTDDSNINTGLYNLIYPLMIIYNSVNNYIDFFIFTSRPRNLECIVDANHTITHITLYPGDGLLYYGRMIYSDLTRNSDTSLIPDFLESSVIGSIIKSLSSYDFDKFLIKLSDDYFISMSDGYTIEVT